MGTTLRSVLGRIAEGVRSSTEQLRPIATPLIAFVALMLLLLVVGLWQIVFVVSVAAVPAAGTTLAIRAYLRSSERPPAAFPEPDAGDEWDKAVDRFATVAREYADVECDPIAVLRTPALIDVGVPATARFVDAFAQAQALLTEHRPDPAHAALFVAAAEHAEQAWAAARTVADAMRLAGIPEAERHTVERVVKLLTTARDSPNEHERLLAYATARSELDRLHLAGVLRLPRATVDALGVAARTALPGPAVSS